MGCRVLHEGTIENPRLVQLMISRKTIIEKRGEEAWDKIYKDICNDLRKSNGLGQKALAIACMYDKQGIINYKFVRCAVFDYDIGEDEVVNALQDELGYYIKRKELQRDENTL